MPDKSDNLVLDGLTISRRVIETIVRLATEQVEGVEVGGKMLRGRVSAGRPVEVSAGEGGELFVGVHVRAPYGAKLRALGDDIRRSIVDALAVQVGVTPQAVHVFIDELSFEN